MTMVICLECHRMLRTVVNQIAYGNDRAMLECRPCGKRYRMVLEEVSGAEVDGWSMEERRERMSNQKGLGTAYALGAYEAVQYIKDIAEKVDNTDGLKALIRDEYNLARSKLYDSIMKNEKEAEK